MTRILLLGAGFSRNWGGQLASEVFDHLIGLPEIRGDEYLKGLLWASRNSGGFENALAEVQAASIADPRKFGDPMRRLQDAVAGVFQNMNEAFFELPNMEFQQHIGQMLRTFLFRFDAIFTLNQDVLLEHHYFRHLDLAAPYGWSGAQLPGMRRIQNQDALDPSWGKDSWVPLDPSLFNIEKGLQPLFKLHGSSNWRDAQGGELLVMGGNKGKAIQSHAVLTWSLDMFREYLAKPNAKLFVIGYGFKDTHVNDVVMHAVENHRLEFFVIDKQGSNVVKSANPSSGGAIYAPNRLDDAFKKGLIGASERNLSETFGGDLVSHKNIMKFFQ